MAWGFRSRFSNLTIPEVPIFSCAKTSPCRLSKATFAPVAFLFFVRFFKATTNSFSPNFMMGKTLVQ